MLRRDLVNRVLLSTVGTRVDRLGHPVVQRGHLGERVQLQPLVCKQRHRWRSWAVYTHVVGLLTERGIVGQVGRCNGLPCVGRVLELVAF